METTTNNQYPPNSHPTSARWSIRMIPIKINICSKFRSGWMGLFYNDVDVIIIEGSGTQGLLRGFGRIKLDIFCRPNPPHPLGNFEV